MLVERIQFNTYHNQSIWVTWEGGAGHQSSVQWPWKTNVIEREISMLNFGDCWSERKWAQKWLCWKKTFNGCIVYSDIKLPALLQLKMKHLLFLPFSSSPLIDCGSWNNPSEDPPLVRHPVDVVHGVSQWSSAMVRWAWPLFSIVVNIF